MTTIRILLADDHSLLRAGIRALLEALTDVEVVAEAADGAEALGLIASHAPDIAMLDIAMPKLGGLDVAARVAQDFPRTRVMILSMHVDEEYIRRAIQVGATGYLLKDSGISELEAAVRAVASGGTYLSPAVSTHLVLGYQRHERGMVVASALAANPLTPRQSEVLRMIAEGLTTKAIACTLRISGKTVEAHRTQLMERLNIHEIAGLVRYAIRTGLANSDA
jgi:DNA-binding NarL/FixJ family response regulator